MATTNNHLICMRPLVPTRPAKLSAALGPTAAYATTVLNLADEMGQVALWRRVSAIRGVMVASRFRSESSRSATQPCLRAYSYSPSISLPV